MLAMADDDESYEEKMARIKAKIEKRENDKLKAGDLNHALAQRHLTYKKHGGRKALWKKIKDETKHKLPKD